MKAGVKSIIIVSVCVRARHTKQAELPAVYLFQRTTIAVGTVFPRTVSFQRSREEKREI